MAIRLARLLRLNFTHTSLGRSTSALSLVFAWVLATLDARY